MRTHADYCFTRLLSDLLADDEPVSTRNSMCRRVCMPDAITFDSLPLITVRPVAWSKALREMEWFLSGSSWCPDELKDWWKGQLADGIYYVDGYPWQLRWANGFDQITYLIESLRDHPYSRRHVITAWNPAEMANITRSNDNPNTPTTCHMTMMQFFVSSAGELSMYSYQRSADVLLGLPHNWAQHWSLLVWLAHHCGLRVGRLTWQGGDAHLYDEQSHLQCAREIVLSDWNITKGLSPAQLLPTLTYTPSTPTGSIQEIADGYRGADFRIAWPDGQSKPEPLSTIRPKLL